MKNQQDATNIFDKIRADAVKKREARLEQQRKTDEFFAKIKNGNDSLKEIQKIMEGNK